MSGQSLPRPGAGRDFCSPRPRDSGSTPRTARATSPPRVRIGSGWNAYTRIVGTGDLNGDGAGDLLAVDAHGYLWRYLGNGHGSFAPRVQIGSGFSIYNAIVGVGDLTGDGRNDYVARDSAGVPWRYDGDGKGHFSARTRIGTGWTIYSALL